MAKPYPYGFGAGSGNTPGWTPQTIAPGVMYRERDFVGNASIITVPPEAPVRQEKGDIGWASMAPPRPLQSGGVPWKNLRKGK